MLTHRTATRPPSVSVSELQQFISTPDDKQLIDIHAWALTKALSESTDSDSDMSYRSASDGTVSDSAASDSAASDSTVSDSAASDSTASDTSDS